MSFCFTMFHLGQPENKISKFIQIKTQFGYKEGYSNSSKQCTLTVHIQCSYLFPLARADRIQTGIHSVIYMKGQDFRFVYQFGYLRT